ncbi:lipid II flippase MurJ [Leisingera sp. S232]|uniref:lipid II flippase MurJ n=1 Tax=Leisingera sp. S232 TaxID=3415132 RepID=UPI003C7B759A
MTQSSVHTSGPAAPSTVPKSRRSLVSKGLAQFSGQALGLLLALVVAHLIARRLGVGAEADAFVMGRRLITAITETLHQIIGFVFMPMVAAQVIAGGTIWSILRKSAGPVFLAGGGLAVGLIAAAPVLVPLIAPGFDSTTRVLATQIMQIFALAVPFAVMTTVLSCFGNVHGAFGSLATIKQAPRLAVALALATLGNVAVNASWAFTIASGAALLLTFAVTLQISRHSHTAPKPKPAKPQRAAHARRCVAAALLAVAALGFLWLETAIAAAHGTGGVAMLDFGQRLGALLGNTLATALAAVVFADLSRRMATADPDLDPAALFQQALVIGLALVLVIACGVALNASALVELLLGYGAFATGADRAEIVALTQMMGFAPVSALVLRMMLMRIVADSDLPLVRLVGIAIGADLLGRLVLFELLVPRMGLTGISLTLILSPVLPALLLLFLLRSRRIFQSRQFSVTPLRPLLAASAFCALTLLPGALLVPQILSTADPKTQALFQLGASGGAVLLVITLAARFLKIRPTLSSRPTSTA